MKREHVDLVAVACGGALGTLGRYGALRAFPVERGEFPTTTLVVNCVASLLLGLFLALLDPRSHPARFLPNWLRPVLVPGVVGGFGTLSLVAVEFVLLLDAHAPRTAAAYLGATLVGGVTLTTAGLWLGGWHHFGAPMPEEDEM